MFSSILKNKTLNTHQTLNIDVIEGTGSISAFQPSQSTGSIEFLVDSLENSLDIKPYRIEYTSLPKKIAFIRWYLSLSLKEIAQILEVSRPTVYSWISEESEPRQKNQNEIIEMYNLLMELSKKWPRPILPQIKNLNLSGKNLFEIMKSNSIHDLENILSESDKQRKILEEKKLNVGKKAKKLGFKEMPKKLSEILDID